MSAAPKIPPAARIGPNGETANEIAQAVVKQFAATLGHTGPVPDLGPVESRNPAANDPVDLPPSLVGEFGRAWVIPVEKLAHPLASVCAWVIEAEWANCMWHSYAVSLIHMREVPGLDPPKVNLPGATHEFYLFALNPQKPRRAMIETGSIHFMTPVNFGAQFVAPNDAAVVERIEATIKEVCDGLLNPDTDSRRHWIARYGDNGMRA